MDARLGLEDVELRRVALVGRIVLVAVVEARDLRDARKLRRLRVVVEAPVLPRDGPFARGEHRGGCRTRRIPALHHRVENAVCGDTPVVRIESADVLAHLRLVADGPHDDGRMVPVALHPLRDQLRPYLHERTASVPIMRAGSPLVYQLVHNQQAHLVCEAEEALGVGIVRAAHGVESESLHRAELTFDAAVENRRAERTEVRVVRHAGEEDLSSVELEAEVLVERDGADSEPLLRAVHYRSVQLQRSRRGVEIRRVDVPEFRRGYRGARKLHLLVRLLAPRRNGAFARHALSVRIKHLEDDLKLVLPSLPHISVELHERVRERRAVLHAGLDVESVAGNGDLALHDEMDVAHDASARVPARAARPSAVRAHGQHVVAFPIELRSEVRPAAEVAVFGRCDLLSVEEDVADGHDALELREDALPLPYRIGLEVAAVPRDLKRLVAVCRTRPLVPGKLELEVMRKVEPAPLRVIAVHGRPRGVVAEPELPRAVHQRVASLELLQRQAFPVDGLGGIWPSVRKREDRDGNRGNRGEERAANLDFHAIILPNPALADNTQSGTIGAISLSANRLVHRQSVVPP